MDTPPPRTPPPLRRIIARAHRSAVILAAVLGSLAAAASRAAADPVAPVNATDNVAVKGYDPVAYFTAGEPTPGEEEYNLVWQGVKYRFASTANRDLFRANPARYVPQYGGYCAYAMAVGRIADIDPQRWEITGGRLYLNANLVAQGLWSVSRSANIKAADQNWAARPKLPLTLAVPENSAATGP